MNAGELTLPIRDAASEQPAFDELMAAHQQRVLRTAYRLLGRMEDAQDASQEVFLRLLKNLDKLNGDPQGWLYRVTVNVCNDQFRRKLTVVGAPRMDRVLEASLRRSTYARGRRPWSVSPISRAATTRSSW